MENEVDKRMMTNIFFADNLMKIKHHFTEEQIELITDMIKRFIESNVLDYGQE